MEGILNIDKPQWLSSHDVVARLRRVCATRRVGHAGTLDPLATGVLLVCVGRTTRLCEYLIGQPKTYEATVRLGQSTTTYDAEGDVVTERPFNHISHAAIEAALSQFRGAIEQTPPIYSALKVNGQPMYKLAREGKEVIASPRPVTIYELELLDWTPPNLQLRVVCSTGTYIRSLAHDVGEVLACGGHITVLRRTAVGEFKASESLSLEGLTTEISQAALFASDHAILHLPRLDADEAETEALLFGQRIPRLPEQPQEFLVRVYDPAGAFFGILRREGELWRPKKMFPPESKETG